MWEAQRVSRLMSNHPVVFRFRRAHAELLQVHGLLVLGNVEDVRSQIGPVPALLAAFSRDANLRVGPGLNEFRVRGGAPGIHMLEDSLPQVGRRVVHESHCQPYSPAPQYLVVTTAMRSGVDLKSRRTRVSLCIGGWFNGLISTAVWAADTSSSCGRRFGVQTRICFTRMSFPACARVRKITPLLERNQSNLTVAPGSLLPAFTAK